MFTHGGAWKKDISHCEILKDYVETSLVLKKETGVIKENNNSFYYIMNLDDPIYKTGKEQNTYSDKGDFVGTLQVGTPLEVSSFRVERIYAGPIVIVAVGKIEVFGEKEMQDFEYIWSHTGELSRAPWDDQSVQEKRILKLTENYECVSSD